MLQTSSLLPRMMLSWLQFLLQQLLRHSFPWSSFRTVLAGETWSLPNSLTMTVIPSEVLVAKMQYQELLAVLTVNRCKLLALPIATLHKRGAAHDHVRVLGDSQISFEHPLRFCFEVG